jgi:hypothetical protein
LRAIVFSKEGVFFAPLILSALDAQVCEIIEPPDELELLAIASGGEVDLIQTTLLPAAVFALARRIRSLDRSAPARELEPCLPS